MEKRNVVYVYDEILFSPQTAGNSDKGYNTDEPQDHDALTGGT